MNDAELLLRAAEIGDELVKIADLAGQDIAGNHIALGLEMLRAQGRCMLALRECRSDQRVAFGREFEERPAAIIGIGATPDQFAALKKGYPPESGRWRSA